MEIGYTTDLCAAYAESLKKCKTVDALKSHLEQWKMLACDAVEQFKSPQFSWEEYRDGAKKEKRGVFAGEQWAEKYGAILMPEVLIRIAIVSNQYLVPDGCAFIRMQEVGQIEVKDGIAKIVQ